MNVFGITGFGAEPNQAPAAATGPTAPWSAALSQDELLARADTAGRILLTRDRKLLRRREGSVPYCPLWFVTANDTSAQFSQLTEHFGITVRPEDLMSRCSRCNGAGYELVSQRVAAERGDVPDRVLRAVTEFWRCRNAACAKLYWEGAKFDATRDSFAGLFAGSGGESGGGGGGAHGVEGEEAGSAE